MLFVVALTTCLQIYGTVAFEISINENRSGLLEATIPHWNNKTSHIYEDIVVFTSSAVPRFTAKGQYLSKRIHLPKQTLTSSPATITFFDLQCMDDASYKCSITYQIRSEFELHTVESNATLITVQVLPDKPQLTVMVNRSTTLTQIHATAKSMSVMNGDNVTFVCRGNVGKPPARFVFQQFLPGHILVNNYTNVLTKTSTVDGMCFYFGESNLSMQIINEDNQAIVRCIVSSILLKQTLHVDSPQIEIFLIVVLFFYKADSATNSPSGSGETNGNLLKRR
ncbi:unnamed protein product [Mytilus edulis]|uniref:CD80-like immunoglobulin C2-set domain-containing protein n=1 Tax=Mytilus edulis TaxID=6550 RepID=A0A8S3TWF7_MYTED|nr:unnamed protein product [Mytilus edulis]